MRSVLLFLLSVCFVFASGQKVKVHVKGVVSDYETLEFKGKTQGEKQFKFGTSTDGDKVKLDKGVIGEDALEIGLVAETASILAVYEKEIQLPLSDECVANGKCIKLKTEAIYTMNAIEVNPKHTTIKCTEKGGEKYKDFTLNHLPAPAGQNAASGTIDVTHEGKIGDKEISLGFGPDKCTIEKVEGEPSVEKIPLELLDTCDDGGKCIKLKTEAIYTLNAIEVKPGHTTIKCTEKGGENNKQFTLNHLTAAASRNVVKGTIDVTQEGKIADKEISLGFGPEKCTIEKATALAAKVITKKDNCVADENDCFQNIEDDTDKPEDDTDKPVDDANDSEDGTDKPDSAYETTLTLSLITICVLLGNML